MHIKWVNTKDLLYSTGHYSKYFVITYKGNIHVCMHAYIYIYKLNHPGVHRTLTQHQKSIIVQ